jgi:hypothetical protein
MLSAFGTLAGCTKKDPGELGGCSGISIHRSGTHIDVAIQHPEQFDVYQIQALSAGTPRPIWLVHTGAEKPLSKFVVGVAPPGFETLVPMRELATDAPIELLIGTYYASGRSGYRGCHVGA